MELKLTNGYTATVDDKGPKKPWRFHWWAYEDKRKDGTVCCKLCNWTKSNRFTYEQFVKIGRLIGSFYAP